MRARAARARGGAGGDRGERERAAERLGARRLVEIALVHDLAEALVGDIAPGQGVSASEKHARARARSRGCAEHSATETRRGSRRRRLRGGGRRGRRPYRGARRGARAVKRIGAPRFARRDGARARARVVAQRSRRGTRAEFGLSLERDAALRAAREYGARRRAPGP